MSESKKDFFARYIRAISERSYDVLQTMIHPEYTSDYPQSGERFRGFASFRWQLENYPGGLPDARVDDVRTKVIIDEDRWALTPSYTVLPLAGPERYTTVNRTPYPDGSTWYIVSVITLKDDLIFHAETYFAPEFEPPEWRKGMVEIVPRE